MKYVLDASVALAWVVPRSLSPQALQLREDFRQGIHELIAPSVFSAEVASALTKCERQKLIPVGQGDFLLANVLNTAPVSHAYEPLLRRATAISSRFRQGLYDCLYVALGERESCEVVTADQKMQNNLQAHFPFLKDLATFPLPPPQPVTVGS